MTTIKFSNEAKCPKCKTGLLSYDASMTQKLPMGFGFAPGSIKFQIDYILRKGWRGECMECGEQVFAITSQRSATKRPASINRKLAALAA